MKAKRQNLGFQIKPSMTVGEKYYEYARALEYEGNKFRMNGDLLANRLEREGKLDSREWYRRRCASARRFVEKIAAMIEAMEIPQREVRRGASS